MIQEQFKLMTEQTVRRDSITPVFGHGFQTAAHMHFLADVFHVSADGFRADIKLGADFLVDESHR